MVTCPLKSAVCVKDESCNYFVINVFCDGTDTCNVHSVYSMVGPQNFLQILNLY